MSKIAVVYWSGTGNTESMAGMLADGAKAAGAEVEMLAVGAAKADDIAALDGFALGCPSMGAEELEDSEMEPFVTELEGKVSGKKIVLFGSYGWGDGEWMRNWTERMTNAGATVIGGEGIIANDAPDAEAEEQLKAAGAELVKRI